MVLEPSELILNSDKSIYHLNLLPQDIADTLILVGDPDRVPEVSKYFDSIELKKGKREFITHTGRLGTKRITVLSTGIGADNIDIVLNELDALVNIDFNTGKTNKNLKSLEVVRIGTSGAIQKDIEVDSFLLSEYALGFDGVLHFYQPGDLTASEFSKRFMEFTGWSPQKPNPYFVKSDDSLREKLTSNRIRYGTTCTIPGFYGPQGRKLRLQLQDETLNAKLGDFKHMEMRITNLEMETSAIYALAHLLGHKAISMNAILANRVTGNFSENPGGTVDKLIRYCLDKLTQ